MPAPPTPPPASPRHAVGEHAALVGLDDLGVDGLVVSLVALEGKVDWPALALFGYAAFLAIEFLTILPRFQKAPLALSWWSYTFPAAAFTVALFTLVRAYPFPFADWLLWAQLTIASLLVLVVMLATLLGLANGKLFVSD